MPDDPAGAYDFGLGAGFYVDATQEPFAPNYRMWTYVTEELPALVASQFPVDVDRQAITGHSMGGHGALTIALRNPERLRSVSAFAPIVAPARCRGDKKRLAGYLGEDRAAWRQHDAVALIEDGARVPGLLVDVGTADSFLDRELKPELLEHACSDAGIPLTLKRRAGYDHSYYFISTFMADHLALARGAASLNGDFFAQALAVGTAIACGLLIGIERGFNLRRVQEGTRIAGIRTFTLLGLLSEIAGLLGGLGQPSPQAA